MGSYTFKPQQALFGFILLFYKQKKIESLETSLRNLQIMRFLELVPSFVIPSSRALSTRELSWETQNKLCKHSFVLRQKSHVGLISLAVFVDKLY